MPASRPKSPPPLDPAPGPSREPFTALGVLRTVLVLVTLLFYAVIAPFGYLAFALLHIVPFGDRVARAVMLQAIVRRAFRLMHRWLNLIGVIKFRPSSMVLGTLPEGACIVVANHPSLADTSIMLASFRRLVSIVRYDLYHRWWLRPLLGDAAHLAGPSRSSLAPTTTIEDAMTRLQQGHRLLVFPEGTRSPADSIHRFGRLGFEIACRAKVQVVPVLIRWDRAWLSKERGLLSPQNRPSSVQLEVLGVEKPESYGGSSRTMRDAVEARFAAALGAANTAAGTQEGGSHGLR